ncbi:MAG: radical SAM superfamily enzyme YgiQ (UPF0313 family) [Pirellulaceae bacterium]|jgi:radical SAM superfamily enzyme YgiQ (UPF0313 family)
MSLPGLRRRAVALNELPALGLLTLAGMLRETWECSYHEIKGDLAATVETVANAQPQLVALSALTASVMDAYELAGAFKQRGIPTVLGGLHATTCAAEAAMHCDAVVVGEGEPVWQQILEDVERGQLQARYQAAKPFDLADSPLPRFDLLGTQKRPRSTLQTERGCPFACDFCGASRLLGPFREKPIENIRAELVAIQNVDANPWIELADDNTFAGARDKVELLDALAGANARYFTEADWRVGEQPEVLQSLARSGCVQLLVGIESMVFRYPGMGAKQSDMNRIMKAIDAIQEAGVVANGCFILGADGETKESMQRMAQFILDSPLAEVQLTLQTPFPGTQLYQRLSQQGRLLRDRNWSSYTLFDVVYQPDSMTVSELEQGFRDSLASVFSNEESSRRERLRRNIWKSNPCFGRLSV